MRPGGAWSPPAQFEEYRLGRLLGRGAMGEVYLAHDTLLDRPVAVKFIAALDPDEHARERFFLEARAIARLAHPNVVAVFRVGEIQGRPYLISELVRGTSLSDLAKPLPEDRARRIGVELARGLAAAHRRGVLHRDLKPANAMISDEGEVKLLDFGLAELVDSPGTAVTEPSPAAGRPVDPDPEATLDHPTGRGAAAPVADQSGLPQGTKPAPVGTPLYMAPEVWRGEPATRRSDVYSLGAVIYELCAGVPPYQADSLDALGRAIRDEDATPLAEVAAISPRFAAVVDACLSREPSLRPGSGDELREALEALDPSRRPDLVPEGNPFPGLRAFGAGDRALFFGRDAEVRAILDRLRTSPFVLIAGDSGVGKSSLCTGGVLPLVDGGGLGRRWEQVRLVPGRHPVTALCVALSPFLDDWDEATLAVAIRSEPAILARAMRQRLGEPVVVFVDQLEEVVSFSEPEEAGVAARALASLAIRSPRHRLLATVRADFLTRLTGLPEVGEEVASALYLLRPLQREGLREAVVGPLLAKGYRFESEEVVESLVASAGGAEGGLPLLQFALAELWKHRDESRRVIPTSALDGIGGVAGALARYADGVLANLLPGPRQAARRILERLVTAEGTRARRSEDELLREGDDSGAAALHALVGGRLLVAHGARDGSAAAYEIAHEALVSGWDTLRGWLSHDAERRAAEHRLERAASEWDRLGRTSDALWTSAQLSEVRALALAPAGAREARFLARSRQAVSRRRWLRWIGLASIPVALAVAYGVVRLQASRERASQVAARMEEAIESLRKARSRSAAASTLRLKAFGHFDRGNPKLGERIWSRVRSEESEADRLLGHAGQALEVALTLDAERRDVRGLLGDVLYQRALLAERRHQGARRDEILRRLEAYDEGNVRRNRWRAPGRLEVATTPAGISVSMARYRSQGGRLVLSAPMDLERTPVAAREVAQGSYLLTFRAAGRAPVRYPILVGRGERLTLRVRIPATKEVPRGFVFIPEGRFLYGSADEQLRRSFFSAPPLHPASTRGFLIARTEVTFRDWIEFLEAQGPRERALRLPRAKRLHTSLELRRGPRGRWWLTFRPSGVTYTVRAGRAVRYRDRKRRASQNWLRFPVAGISFDDVRAYARWLSATGKVPGARLCNGHEWVRAGRGADGRSFPGGDVLAPDDANHDVTYGRRPGGFGPDEVGSHPRSRSPFGIDDLAGNVWEWTVSATKPGQPVLRGGSWYQGALTSQLANREASNATLRDSLVGARICATVR